MYYTRGVGVNQCGEGRVYYTRGVGVNQEVWGGEGVLYQRCRSEPESVGKGGYTIPEVSE